MTSGAPEIHEPLKTGQIKGRDHRWRTELAETIHALKKILHSLIGAEEVVEDAAILMERLLPLRAAMSNRIFQMCPELEEDSIGVENIAGDGVRRTATEVGAGHWLVLMDAVGLVQKPEPDTCIQQPLQRLALHRKFGRQLFRRLRFSLEGIEYAERDCNQHCFPPTKSVDKRKHRSVIG